MSYRILYLFCSLWAISAALNPTKVESFFYVVPGNTINQPLIQTKNNIIAYTVEVFGGNGTLAPQFLSIDLKAGEATRILDDIMNACGQNNATYNRIYYHAGQSALVYYCTRNNTLLILDEDNYTVIDAIAVQVTGQFNETKISAEGDSVVILGTGTPFTTTFTAAQLVKINLSTKQVVRLVTFATGLADGEILTSYASSGLLSFVLTNQVDTSSFTTIVTIYSAIFIGNNYKLTKMSTFSYGIILPQRTNELYVVGDYLVTNSYQDLLFINIQGGISQTFASLVFFAQASNQSTNILHGGKPEYFEVPNYAVQYGSSDLYAHFLNHSLLQISANGLVLTSNFITETTEAHIVIGNQNADDLLFTATGTGGTEFSVLIANTGSPIYDSYNFLTRLYLTNNSYVVTDFTCGIVDRKTNSITESLPIVDVFFESYFEPINQVLYYLDYNRSNLETTACTIKYIQPDTLATGEVLSFDLGGECMFTTFIYVEHGDDIATPNFALNVDGSFLIYSKEYGQINYKPQTLAHFIVPNFQDMSVYEISVSFDDKTLTISNYTYNGTTFNLQKSYTLNNIPFQDFLTYLVVDSNTLAAYDEQLFAVISLSEGTSNSNTVPYNISVFTGFQDNLNQSYVIIANETFVEGLNYRPYIFGPDKVPTPLPESDEYTVQAGGAGSCTYWIEQGYVSSFGVARFYDICSQDKPEYREYELFDIIS